MNDAANQSEFPAWTDESLAAPHTEVDKASRVNQMFGAIAGSYDLNNRVHSLWMDQSWRRRAVRMTEVRPGEDEVVDVACGTGDLAMEFAEWAPRSVLGVDFTPQMIEIARRKAAVQDDGASLARRVRGERRRWTSPVYRVGDAMDLDLPDASADIVSIAFGIRNVADPALALAEFRRILRPGGRLLILEFSLPTNPVLRHLYLFYFHHIMPRTATWLSRDRSGAYRYLPRSVSTFLGRAEICELMSRAGFESMDMKAMTCGICVAYLGRVPTVST
ncbi:MAG: ubiquinone/menaquinone biosynthesis methyltransferase [Phycisphaerales bacterium]